MIPSYTDEELRAAFDNDGAFAQVVEAFEDPAEFMIGASLVSGMTQPEHTITFAASAVLAILGALDPENDIPVLNVQPLSVSDLSALGLIESAIRRYRDIHEHV